MLHLFHLLMIHSAEVGLVLFVLCFAAIMFFAFTRSRQELDAWAHLPLGPSSSSQDSHDLEDAQ